MIVRVLCLWILIFQGQGNQDPVITTVATLVIFGIFNGVPLLMGAGKLAIKGAKAAAKGAAAAASATASVAGKVGKGALKVGSKVGRAAAAAGAELATTEDDEEFTESTYTESFSELIDSSEY